MELQAAGRLEDYDDVGSTRRPDVRPELDAGARRSWATRRPQASRVRIRGTYTHARSARRRCCRSTAPSPSWRRLFDVNAEPDGPRRRRRPPRPTARCARSATRSSSRRSRRRSPPASSGARSTGLFIEGDYWNYDYEDIIVKENAQQILAADFMLMGGPNDTPRSAHPARPRDRRRAHRSTCSFINARRGDDARHRRQRRATAATSARRRACSRSACSGSYVLAYKIPQSSVPPELWTETFVDCIAERTAQAVPTAMPPATWPASATSRTSRARCPKLRVDVPLGWTLDGHTAAVIGNYIGGYKDDVDSRSEPMRRRAASSDIDSWFTVDLQYALRIDEGEDWRRRSRSASINLLDTDPPDGQRRPRLRRR